MIGWVARLAARRSRWVIGIWILLVILLAAEGRDLDRKLTVHPIFVDGTASKRAHEIALREFGSDYSMIVMLRGPSQAVQRQGRTLAVRLDAIPRMLVVSPWAHGAAVKGLMPKPGVAALVVRVEGGDVTALLPPVQRQVDGIVRDPVRASIAGFPVAIDSIRSGSEQASKVGELIAVPVLLVVLLLVFRSVLAAVLPVVIGGAVVAATRGVLSLLLGTIQIDLFAVGVVGMMGLALGVDYSLLVVSRFREERADADIAEAVQATVRATARSVVPAGCALVLAMVVTALLLPGSLVRSVAIAVSLATVLSMLSAVFVTPAMLTILDGNLDRWSWPRREGSQVAPLLWSRRVSRHPQAIVGIMLVLVFLAGWAFTLKSGAASVALLPPGDSGRRQQEEVRNALGPGWIAPMEVVVNGRGHPVISSDRLRYLAAFQRKVERDPGVVSVAGLRPVERGVRRLEGIEGQLADQERGLDKLEWGISRARHGAALMSSGLGQAAKGSSGLRSGLGAAHAGAGVLADALQMTSTGSNQLARGLGQADEGSGQLAEGTTKASKGAGKLADGLAQAKEKTGEMQASARLLRNAMHSGEDRLNELHAPLRATEEQLAAARQALQRMTTGQGDPEYAAALRAVEEADSQLTGKDPRTGEPSDPPRGGVEEGVERAQGQFGVGLYLASQLDHNGRQASKGIGKLARGSAQLDHGLRRLAAGSRRLSEGVAALAGGGEKLSPALQRVSTGAERLASGLGLLETGSGRLTDGLSAGAEKSKLLTGGLDRIGDGLKSQRGSEEGGSQLDQLHQQSPGLFKSAYFVLAGLDGSRPEQRNQLSFLVNLDRGGMDARILVIPRDESTSAEAEQTKDRVESEARDLARKTGAEVLVGGVTPAAIDANDALRGQAVPLRLALSLVSLLILIPVMRSLAIPVLAALINLLTVSASFGLLALLFNGSLLGGPGYVDAGIIPATVMVMFGLAIDYEVFVFARVREEYVRTGSTNAAVSNGLDRTAHVVTGAAIIMISVFLAFSVSAFMSVRNFGVALAVAVFIDAFIVRLMIVPSMMGWLGKWNWWMPRWLDRFLPGISPVAAGTEKRGGS